MYLMDYIQMGLLILVIPALIFSISFLGEILTKCSYCFFTPEVIGSSKEAAHMYTIIKSVVGMGMFFLSFSSYSRKNRSAYLLYWDKKAEKLRGKTVMIKQFEAEHGNLHTGEFVCIAAEERKAKVRFVCLMQKEKKNNSQNTGNFL